jgi:N,N'-diacetylchitobiose transport system substrate-binding protein
VRYVRFVALAMSALLVLSACGSDDDADEASDAGPSEESGTIRLWLNGPDTPDEMVDFAIAEFNELHPDVEVVFERQQWDGIVERLTTALSSDDSPDVIELGNTQAQSFEAAGALLDLTDNRNELGGDDLLQSLVEAGTYDGRFYGVPYYAGARIVVYRTDLLAQAGLGVPETMEEFVETGIALKQANAAVPNFSGIYFPGRNWHAALTFIWEAGGDIAVQDGDAWEGVLGTDESIEGLEMVQRIMTEANGAPADSDDAQDFAAFCNGEVGMLMGPGWKVGQILDPEDGCPAMEPNIGVFALPGGEAGETAPVFLGGSNLAVSANSANPELAQDLVEIMVGEEFQTRFAELGLLPARTSLLDLVGGTPANEAQAEAATNSRFVPSSENWAAVEAANVLPDMLVAIAQGGDVAAEAERADSALEDLLNR